MKKMAFIIMLLTLLSKITGFARDLALSYFYGTSSISDAYLISLTIPETIFSFIGVGMSVSYIPIYNSIVKEDGINSADRFTNNLKNLIFIICILIVFLTLIFSEPIVKIFASGFMSETLDAAVLFTRISILAICFSGIIYVFSSYLYIHNNFVIPTIIGIPANLFIILSIILSISLGKIVLPIGSVIAVASQLMILLPFVYKNSFKNSFTITRQDKNIEKMIHLSIPAIIGTSVNQVNLLVDRTIASVIAIGGISALNYASKLKLFIHGLFAVSLATVLYPKISMMAAKDDIHGFKKSLYEAINSISILVIPATVGAMIFAQPIVKLLFGRGAFDSEAVYMTSNALLFYSIGMIGIGLREILSRAFYSLKDTKTPMINAAIAMVINIILNIILSKFMGIGGLALATSISAIFCTALLFISLRKKIGSFGIKNIATTLAKILCASLLMGLISKIIYNSLITKIGLNLSLIVSVGIGVVVYFVIIYFMKIEDVNIVINTLKEKLNKAMA